MILFARHFHMGHRDGGIPGKRLAEGLLLHSLYLRAIFMERDESPYILMNLKPTQMSRFDFEGYVEWRAHPLHRKAMNK